MIKKINTGIPSQTNKKIIDTLFNTSLWRHAKDGSPVYNINQPDCGMAIITFGDSIEYTPHEILNVYAGVIFDIVQKNSLIQFKKINRYYWNWYSPGSIGTKYHEDHPNDNKYSIIYNLHTNDGGTIFKINEEEKFEKSVESEAIVFPSKITHKGIPPKKSLHRLNLNIITEI